jgi:hypothetical protein
LHGKRTSKPLGERLRGKHIESGATLFVANGKGRQLFVQADAKRRAFILGARWCGGNNDQRRRDQQQISPQCAPPVMT